MKQTFTVLVYLKTSKINSKGMAPIYIRVTLNGKRSEISIKQFIEPTRWNSNRQRLTGTSYRVKTVNKSIELAINRINDIQKEKFLDSLMAYLNKKKIKIEHNLVSKVVSSVYEN